MDLSIIIPVYNVERYVRPCIESIFRQSLDEKRFDVIIVNDGSTDNSMGRIDDIISQHNNITIINQENQGLSVARNNGIAAAKGEYILMPDSDDLLIDKKLPKLLDAALLSKADIVVADFLITDDKEIEYTKTIPQEEFAIKEKTGEQLFIEDLNPHQCYVWRSLFRRQFILDNNIKFVPGILYQDVPFTHECYIKAQKCLRANWHLNIYRKKRYGSATSSFDFKKTRDFSIAIAKTWELTQITGLPTMVDKKLKEDIWTSFSILLRHSCVDYISNAERISIIDFLRQEAPNLSFTNGKKQRATTWLYRKMPHTLIRLRYLYGSLWEEKIRPFCLNRLRRPLLRR